VTADPVHLQAADAVILPGVGSAPAAMAALQERGLVSPLKEYVTSGRPFLGVCLGLQLLLERTEEGAAECLGLVSGEVKRLPSSLKVPHMGWNSVRFNREHPTTRGIPQDSYFYFVHSYYAAPTDTQGMVGTTEYSIPFCSVYARGNLVATQFHPEKSGALGLRFYQNFVAMAAGVAALHPG
ncbi:MAG: imidazole glycerol phosphate synthase subunit HisH, partial [Chloroflexota bacterium]